MTTKLDGALKREVTIGGAPYTITIDPRGLKLVPKGKRKGYELEWDAFVNGEAALATALNAAIAAAPEPRRAAEKKAATSDAPSSKKKPPATHAPVRPKPSRSKAKTRGS